jgi:hypothetical protein
MLLIPIPMSNRTATSKIRCALEDAFVEEGRVRVKDVSWIVKVVYVDADRQ